MGFKDWLKSAFGVAKVEAIDTGAPQVVTLREAAIAKQFPVQTPRTSEGRRRADVGACVCGGALREVIVTTGGALGDATLWRAHPLAVDGWYCASCSQMTLPRFLEPAEIAALGKRGVAAAQGGDLDEAEMCFRRIANAWPGYAPGHSDLATLLGQRLVAAENAGASLADTQGLLVDLRFHLVEALQDAPPPPRPHLAHLLARAWLREQNVEAATKAVDDVIARVGDASDAASTAERAELGEIREWVINRGDLYDRGAAKIEPHMRLHDRPWRAPDAATRASIDSGIADLLQHIAIRKGAWQALWLAGKGRQALGDNAGAAELFGRAVAINPTQIDVRREHGIALQEAGDFQGAIEAARAACAVAPDDAGLVSNLALAQLFAADLVAAHASATTAVAMDASDPINKHVLRVVTEVRDGKRPQPKSVKDLGA